MSSLGSILLQANGRLAVFATGNDKQVHALLQQANDSWSWVQSLPPLGPGISGAPAAGSDLDGRLEVFAVGAADRSLWHAAQLVPGGYWSGWSSLGGGVHSPTLGLALGVSPTVARNADGRLEVFVASGGGPYFHAWQAQPNGAWSALTQMASGEYNPIAVALNQGGALNNLLEAFMMAGDSTGAHLYTVWQTASGFSNASGMQLGYYFSGEPALAASPLSVPQVARNLNGTLEVFVLGADGGIVHEWQLTAGTDDWAHGWSAQYSLGRPGSSAVASPAVASNLDGRLEVFAVAADGGLWHSWQTTPSGTWSGWSSLGPPAPSGSNLAPVVARNADGRLEVFAISRVGDLWHISQVSAGGAWSQWWSQVAPLMVGPNGLITPSTVGPSGQVVP
jgi:hypothetical protein